MTDMQPHDPPAQWQPPGSHPPPQSAAPTVQAPLQPVASPPPQLGYVANTYLSGFGGATTDQRPASGAVIAIAWIAAVLTIGYMLPWAIAATRGRSNQAAIGVIDLLLGWTFIGWIVALVMACQAHQVVHHGPHAAVIVAQNIATPASPPAGWYPAPSGYGQQYWDGTDWTEHRSP